MPGETKIFKNSSGWYDADNPGVYHATRAACRDARRGTTSLPTHVTSAPRTGLASTSDVVAALNSLQRRLYGRLTSQQGVSVDDALYVILANGYNKAASYGHMREAGATHVEATAVIDLDSPSVSVAYGQHRAVGYNHADALRDAVVVGGLDDDDND